MPSPTDLTVTLDAGAITRAVLAGMPDRNVERAAGSEPAAAVPLWLRGGIWACDPAAIEGLAAMAEAAGGHLDHATEPFRAESDLVARSGGGGSVAVIPLHGFVTRRPSIWSALFGGASLVELEASLRSAANDPQVSAIVIDCDSPGGSVTGVHEAFEAVRAANAVKPVHVAISGLCASAAYWIAAGASRISISPSAEAGSIGVFGVHADRSAFFAAQGITFSVFASPATKAENADVLPLTDDARLAMRRRVESHYARFAADVAAGRGTTAEAVRDGYGQGRVVGSADALAAGLVDAIETPAAAIGRVVDQLSDRSRRLELARFRSEVAEALGNRAAGA
jgi:signal peptide peptidase SppA